MYGDGLLGNLEYVRHELIALRAALETQYGLSPYWQGRLNEVIRTVATLEDRMD
jgi:hypothetical protein